jgi:hypothetical protein
MPADHNGTPSAKGGRRTRKSAGPIPPVPKAAALAVKLGGTLALLAAAAISAQTLYRLGRVMGWSAGIAWLLPAMLDIYASTSIFVAYQIPAQHPARKHAVHNAWLALSFTVAGNVTYHALYLNAHSRSWSGSDVVLTMLSALPPVVVERLLHLQALLSSNGNPQQDAPVAETPARPKETSGATVSGNGHGNRGGDGSRQPSRLKATEAGPVPINIADRSQLAEQRARAARDIVRRRGPEEPLSTFQGRLGISKGQASKMRANAVRQVASGDFEHEVADRADDPEPVGAVAR